MGYEDVVSIGIDQEATYIKGLVIKDLGLAIQA